MNKHLSIILSTAACAALIAAAGLSQSSAQEATPPKEPGYSPAQQPHGQSKGTMQGQSKGTMQGKESSDQRVIMERATDTDPGNIRMVTVTVKDVDRAANMVTFQAKVSPEANIKQNGQRIRLDELQAGDSLKIAFDPRSGEVMRAEVIKKARQ